MRKIVIPVIIIIIVIVGGYFGYRYYQQIQAGNQTNYQTVRLERGNLTATIGGTGTVRSNQTALMTWKTSGTLETVNVSVGTSVKAGDVLASLKQSTFPANIIQAQIDLTNAKKKLDDLNNSSVAQKQAWLNLTNTQKAVLDAQKSLDEIDTTDHQNKVDDAQTKVSDANDTLKTAQDDFNTNKDLTSDNQKRKDSENKLKDAQAKYNDAVRTYQLLLLELEQAKINLQLAQSQEADAQREYDRLKNGPDPDDIAALKSQMAAAESTLSMSHLDTPFNGTVTEVDSKIGDQISAGTNSFRIDDLSKLLIDVQIPEVDIDRVTPGMTASLKFDAIPDKEYSGKVTEVSGVGVNQQGVVNFKVTIELLEPDENVHTGMTAAVTISVKQLDKVLLVPNRAVHTQDGKRVIYVLRNGAQQMVEIKIGTISDTYSEIVSGDVAEGDIVILNPTIDTTKTFTGPSSMGGF